MGICLAGFSAVRRKALPSVQLVLHRCCAVCCVLQRHH